MILSLKQLFSESVEKSSLMKNTGPTHASVNDAEQLHLVQRKRPEIILCFRGQSMMVISGRVMVCPKLFLSVPGRAMTATSQKSAEEQTRGAVRAVLSSLSSPDINSFIHVCASVGGLWMCLGDIFAAAQRPHQCTILFIAGKVWCIVYKCKTQFVAFTQHHLNLSPNNPYNK